jgi:flagellar hook-associated protein 1 FlgK
MVNAREELLANGGTATIEQYTAQLISGAGDNVRQLELEREHATVIASRLLAERESVSGVNPDEEMVLMLQYQRGYEVAARFIAAIRDTTAELISLVR